MREALMLFRLIVACGAAAVAAGTALADDASKTSSCAMMRMIDGFGVIDDRTALLTEVSPKRRYKVTFVGTCRDMKHANFAFIERRVSSGICLAPGDEIAFTRRHPKMRNPDSNIPEEEQRCVIKSIEPTPGDDAKPESGPVRTTPHY
jgi:hypothetical protein